MNSIFVAVLFFFSFFATAFADGSSVNLPAETPTQLPHATLTLTPTPQAPEQYFLGLSNHDLVNIFWGGVLAFGLVVLTEWLKTPAAKIEIIPPLNLPQRKLLKVRVKIFVPFWKKLFRWQNPALVGKLKGQFLAMRDGKEIVISSFTAKWDANPEPFDYNKNKPRIELLPAASQPQHFLAEDEDTASVVAKHATESHFYIFDANYYVGAPQNVRKEKEIKLRLIFASSSATAKRDFIIKNPGKSLSSFSMIPA